MKIGDRCFAYYLGEVFPTKILDIERTRSDITKKEWIRYVVDSEFGKLSLGGQFLFFDKAKAEAFADKNKLEVTYG